MVETAPEDEDWDPSKMQWFNSLQVSLFVRDPNSISDERELELHELVKTKIPGHDFDSFHLPIMHHTEHCIAGDIFAHEKAKKYDQLHTITRKFPTLHGDSHPSENDSFDHTANMDNDLEEYAEPEEDIMS